MRYIIGLILIFGGSSLKGQSTIVGISPHFMLQYPMGDLSNKFTSNSNFGVSLNLKLKNNWTIGVEGQYLFGSDYNDLTLLGNAVTSGGFVIGKDLGSTDYTIETPSIEGRGGNFFVEGGKIIPISKNNKNSGIHIKAGIGAIYYKTTVFIDDLLAKQISGDYGIGYNRQESGISFNFFTGYTFYSENRFLNGSIGLQYIYFNSTYSNGFDYANNKTLEGNSFSNFLIGPKASLTIILKSFEQKGKGVDGYFYN